MADMARWTGGEMRNGPSLAIILAVLLYSIFGQHGAEHRSHSHLLIGPVTPEQLAEHQAEEVREGRPLVVTFSSNDVMTIHGGVIVSLLFGPEASPLPAVLGAFLVVPVLTSRLCSSVSFPRRSGRSLARTPQDPPPRFIFRSS
jgi:hypothetical protein